MADASLEAVSNTEVSRLFPVQPDFLVSLVESFPKEWRGVLASLNAETLPLKKACNWLENQRPSSPHWPGFLDSLVLDFPVVSAGDVCFLPKICVLPLNVQRNLLGFILYNSKSIPCENLEKFVDRLDQFKPSDPSSWNNTLKELLRSEIRKIRAQGNSASQKGKEMVAKLDRIEIEPLVHVEIICEKSQPKFVGLCDKIRAIDCGTRTCPVYATDLWVLKSRPAGNQLDYDKCGADGKQGIVPSTGTYDTEAMIGRSTPNVDFSPDRPLKDNDVEMIEILESPVERSQTDELMDINVEDLMVPCPPGDFPQTTISEEKIPDSSLIRTLPVQTVSSQTDACVPDNFPAEANPEKSKVSVVLSADVALLKEAIQNLQGSRECQSSLPLSPLITCAPSEMEAVCLMLNLGELTEPAAITLCQQFTNSSIEPSHSNGVIFSKHLILPRLEQVSEGAASRVFTETVCSFAKKHPRAFCDGVILHLVCSTSFGAFQADLLCRVISDTFSKDVASSMLQNIIETRLAADGSIFQWSEPVLMVLLCVINSKWDLFDKALFESYALMLEQQAALLAKSLKFAKLLLATINKYPAHVRAQHNLFQNVLQNNDTFFKKAAITALKKVMK